ncbi:MAG: alpha/beta fold hydrolase [Opitutales bacterium]
MSEPLSLNYQYFGGEGNPPLVILHGLLGSSRNWTSVGRELAKEFEVFALDLRNHGQSPHSDEMDYALMAGDVKHFLDNNQLESVTLVGHSMGGKTAMRLAVDSPKHIKSLVVVDISPKPYPSHNLSELGTMQALPLDTIKSRKEAEAHFEDFGITDWAHRQFLLTNLVRDAEKGGFKWQVNVAGIDRNMALVANTPLAADERFEGPTLFIRGEQSDFMQDDDVSKIQEHFPYSRIDLIPNAGHNVHVENKVGFLEALATLKNTDWGCEV